MNDFPPPPNRREDENTPGLRFVWLFCAFLPALLLIGLSHSKNAGESLVFVLIAGVVCIAVSSLRLARGMKSKAAQAVVAVFLMLFFFVANAAIAVFVGCSGF